MNFIAHLSERSKPPSDIKIKKLLPHAIDIYRWRPATAMFTKVCYLFEDGTVIVYFKNSMLAIQVPPDAFDGEFLPKNGSMTPFACTIVVLKPAIYCRVV